MPSFAEKVRHHMARQKLTAYRLAQLSGVGQAALSKLFRGDSAKPTLDTAMALADALGVTVNDLLPDREKG